MIKAVEMSRSASKRSSKSRFASPAEAIARKNDSSRFAAGECDADQR